MKFRVHVWKSISGSRPDAYGIQGQFTKDQRYRHVRALINGVWRALIYKNRNRAEEIVDSLNRAGGPPINYSKGLTPLANRTRRNSRSKVIEALLERTLNAAEKRARCNARSKGGKS